jgi:hypothetical protein
LSFTGSGSDCRNSHSRCAADFSCTIEAALGDSKLCRIFEALASLKRSRHDRSLNHSCTKRVAVNTTKEQNCSHAPERPCVSADAEAGTIGAIRPCHHWARRAGLAEVPAWIQVPRHFLASNSTI